MIACLPAPARFPAAMSSMRSRFHPEKTALRFLSLRSPLPSLVSPFFATWAASFSLVVSSFFSFAIIRSTHRRSHKISPSPYFRIHLNLPPGHRFIAPFFSLVDSRLISHPRLYLSDYIVI